MHDVRPAVRIADADRPTGPGLREPPPGDRVVADEIAEPQDHRLPATQRELGCVALGDRGRLDGSGHRTAGSCSVIHSSPPSAYRNETLSWTSWPTPASRAASRDDRGPVGPQPVVDLPGTASQCRTCRSGCWWRGCRRPRSRAAHASAHSRRRAGRATGWRPAASSLCGLVRPAGQAGDLVTVAHERRHRRLPRTPVAPVTKTFTKPPPRSITRR